MSSEFITLFLGGSILVSILIARGASLLKTPLIVGYIVAGALLGPAVFNLLKENQIANLDIINTITLAFIGFGIGGELKFSELKKLGMSILTIVFFEATAAFVLVSVVTSLLLNSIPLGLIYGALASATAPAGTVEVIRQYKAKGDLTTTLYAVMGLDDIYALLLYTIATPIAIIFLGGSSNSEISISHELLHAGLEVLLSVGIGAAVGFILTWVAAKIHDRVMLMLLALGVIFINCGISDLLHLSPILLNMACGIVAVNYKGFIAKKIFTVLGEWTPPLYVWFFVLIGSRLNIHLIFKFFSIVILYVLARSIGKWGGTFLGAKVSKAPTKTQKYLGLALFSQAGVAIGLALAVSKSLEQQGFHDYAVQIMSVMTATTFIVMLFGPIFAKTALFKSGEAQVRN
jgi:Kef-type K+ transport system membrane component KefB